MTNPAPHRRLSLGKVFLVAVLAGAGFVVADTAWQRHRIDRAIEAVAPRRLAAQIDVSTQLELAAVSALGQRYVKIIDLRPDGEVEGQPSSAEMAQAARRQAVDFGYVPVPHGEIPEEAVLKLRQALADQKGQVLLYCRSGKRAARTWALAEAGRVGGLQADEIIAAVRGAGQEADDLRPRIEAAIAARGAAR
jgi:uncharacterized protein (TIGR01244 family)